MYNIAEYSYIHIYMLLCLAMSDNILICYFVGHWLIVSNKHQHHRHCQQHQKLQKQRKNQPNNKQTISSFSLSSTSVLTSTLPSTTSINIHKFTYIYINTRTIQSNIIAIWDPGAFLLCPCQHKYVQYSYQQLIWILFVSFLCWFYAKMCLIFFALVLFVVVIVRFILSYQQ